MRAVADVGLPYLFDTQVFSLIAAVIGLVAVILLEAVVLRLLQWKPFLKSLMDSFLMNSTSAVVGFFALLKEDLKYASPLLILVVCYLLSFIFEGLLLTIRKGNNRISRAGLVALSANFASYAAIAFLMGQYPFGVAFTWAFIVSAVLLTPTIYSDKEAALKQKAAGPSQ